MPRPASARRDEEEYRQYSTPVRNGPTQAASGCSAARMQRDFHHGLLVLLVGTAVACSGCGYTLAGRGAFLPDYIRTIGIPMFENTTTVF